MGIFKKGKKEEEFEMVMVRKKKPFYKRFWFWVIAIIVVFGMGSCSSDDTQEYADNSNSTEQTTEQKAEVKTEEKKEAKTEEKKAKYEILESSFEPDTFGGYIVGKLKNNSGKEVGYLQIEINLYDADGNQLGSTLANINNLEDGAVWNFKAAVLEENVASFKIKDVTGF